VLGLVTKMFLGGGEPARNVQKLITHLPHWWGGPGPPSPGFHPPGDTCLSLTEGKKS